MADRKFGLVVAGVGVAAFLVGGVATYLTMRLVDAPPPPQVVAVPATPPQAEPAEGDVVIAVVNDEKIYRSELVDAFAQLPPQAQQLGMEFVYQPLLERLVNTRLLAGAARVGLSPDDQEVAKRMSETRDQIMVQVYFQRQLDERLTDEALQSSYDQYLADNPPQEEVRARHILLETEEKAKEVLARIKGGTDFAEAAKEFSTGPSGASGGDLGYFTKEQMVAPFADAAFAMNAGDVSESPVQTEFGWHIIKVEDRRSQPPPSFDEMRDELSDELSREFANEIVTALREKATIETFDMDGNPVPAEGEQPAGEQSQPQQ